MDYLDVFKRYEIKYLITDGQRARIDEALAQNAVHDVFGKTAICNIYYDTPDFRLIRRSLEKPVYKEKLRMRSYGTPTADSRVFLELKKKYDSVTYKRRIGATLQEAQNWLALGHVDKDCQIAREIDYSLGFYKNLVPAVYISYEREAFKGIKEKDFRITFDKNILWRDYDLTLSGGAYGRTILPEGYTLMELKTPGAFPMWLTKVLSECKLYSTHFSKYGNAYEVLSKERRLAYGAVGAEDRQLSRTAAGGIIYAH